MSKAIVLKGDNCSGHGCFPPRASLEGSPDVFVESKGVVRVGDSWAIHSCPKIPPHAGTQAEGSETVFINGKGIAREGDSISCGSKAMGGSRSVFAG